MSLSSRACSQVLIGAPSTICSLSACFGLEAPRYLSRCRQAAGELSKVAYEEVYACRWDAAQLQVECLMGNVIAVDQAVQGQAAAKTELSGYVSDLRAAMASRDRLEAPGGGNGAVSGGRIAMDHGSHSFCLAFDWLNAWPTSVTAKMVNREPGLWDTEDEFSATLMFPGDRTAHAHTTWTAGGRSVIYTLHGERGAIIARDDDIEVLTQRQTTRAGEVTWEVENRLASSSWMDASHTEWFNAMFDRFLTAVESGDYAGEDIRDACRCVAVIREAYASSSASCVERRLLAPPGFEQRRSARDRRVADGDRGHALPLTAI